jgi:hypothetical protein
MPVLLANNAVSTLQAGISDAVTSLTIDVVDADLFPNPDFGGAEEYFILTLEDRRVVPNLREILVCTARSGAVLTVQRGIETSASAFSAGATVSMRLTAVTLANLVGDQVGVLNSTMTASFADVAANIATEAEARADADAGIITTQQAYTNAAVAAEASARASVDAALQAQRENDVSYINIQVAGEAAARASVDSALQAQRDGDITYINTQDTTLQTNINNEAATRLAADVAEAAARLATAYIRTGVFTTNGAGAFVVSFSPAYGSQLTFWAHGVYIAGGVIGGFDSMVFSTSGVSGRALDPGGVPLPGATYGWFSVGY